MKLYQKIIGRHLLFYSLIGLVSTQSTLAHAAYEPMHERETVNYDDYHQPRSHTQAPQEEEISVLKITWNGFKNRGYEVLSEVNPFNFIVPFTVNFLMVHILIDKVITSQNSNANPGYTPRKISWESFAYEGILFYLFNSMYKLLLTGSLQPILTCLEGYSTIYRLCMTVFSTSLTGAGILPEEWWISMGIIIAGTVLLSWLLPSPEKKESTQAYVYTNLIFVLLAWLSMQGIWYAFIETNKCDDFLTTCGFDISHKKENLEAFFMSDGNLTIFTLWKVFKGRFWIDMGGHSFTRLSTAISSHQVVSFAKSLMDKITNKHLQTTVQYVMQNLIFELLKDMLL